MSDLRELWVIRHPPVDRRGRCIGQSRAPMTMPVAEAAGHVLEQLDTPPRHLVSSDLPRCAELAAAIASRIDATVSLEPRVREVSFGRWEGRPYAALDREESELWRAWCDDWVAARPPQGESALDLCARVGAWLAEFKPLPHTMVVTHAGVIRSLRVLGGISWEDAMGQPVPHLRPLRLSLPRSAGLPNSAEG